MRVLVIQTAFLGDVMLTLPLLSLLRVTGVATSLAVLAAPAGARFLETQNVIDEIIVFDKRAGDRGLTGTIRAARACNKFRPEAVLVPHRSFRSALIAWLMRAPRRIGFDESGGRMFLTTTVPYCARDHEIERIASLAEVLGATLPEGRLTFRIHVPGDAARRVAALLAGGIGASRMAVLAPGSRWATKRWPAAAYAALADRLASSGLGIVLAGGDDDCEASAEVASLAKTDVLDLTGRLDLGEWLALVAASAIVVSNDSAAAHVAAGVGVPVVAIFGPTVPAQGFAPYTDIASVVGSDLECRPCGRHGADRCRRGTLQCMEDVSVDAVYDAALELLGAADHPGRPFLNRGM